MTTGLVSQHQQAAFANPQAGQAGTASVVLGNDNATVTTYNTHDADPSIHVQNSALASRPAAAAAGAQAMWMTYDTAPSTVRLFYSDASSWYELNYLGTPITIAGGTVTTNSPLITMTETWNSTAVAFVGMTMNITDTNSMPNSAGVIGSLLLDLKVGGATLFAVNKQGRFYSGGTPVLGVSMSGTNAGGNLIDEAVTVPRAAAIPRVSLLRINTSYAAPSAVLSGDVLGQYSFGGSTSGTTLTFGVSTGGARIESSATENWSATQQGAQLYFSVTATGGTTQATALVLGNDKSALFASVGAFAGATISTTVALNLPAGTTGVASLRVPAGVAPTSPVDGDHWQTTDRAFVRIGSDSIGYAGVPIAVARNGSQAASTTLYCTYGFGANATEAQAQYPMPFACTVSGFRFMTSTAQPADGALVVTVRKNGADTAILTTVGAAVGAGTFSSNASASFAKNDLLSVSFANASTAPAALSTPPALLLT